MITCIHCNRELPEEDFYPSVLKKGWRICKKCMYKRNRKYVKSYINRKKPGSGQEKTFDNLLGGYTIFVLNTIKPKEFRFSLKGTNGDFLQTNDLKVFKTKLNEIFSRVENGSK